MNSNTLDLSTVFQRKRKVQQDPPNGTMGTIAPKVDESKPSFPRGGPWSGRHLLSYWEIPHRRVLEELNSKTLRRSQATMFIDEMRGSFVGQWYDGIRWHTSFQVYFKNNGLRFRVAFGLNSFDTAGASGYQGGKRKGDVEFLEMK